MFLDVKTAGYYNSKSRNVKSKYKKKSIFIMINEQTFKDAYIAKLTGIAEYKNENEIWWENPDCEWRMTIEFVDNSISFTKVRYYKDGNKRVEENRINGKLNGKYISWHEDGSKCREQNFVDGRLNGTWTSWNKDGTKYREESYIDWVLQ